tara:strand:- start:125 stop:628 length:504 start_codon:yes stop_codon:yes gene_type:complete
MKAILEKGKPKYQSSFKTFTDVDGRTTATKGATEQQWIDWGFKNVYNKTILDTQYFGEWYETKTDILRYVIDKTAEKIAIDNRNIKDMKIAGLEAAGVDVEYLDSTFHFSREMASQLLGATQLCEKLGAEIVEWKNNNSIFVEIPIQNSYAICGEALQKFILIHKNN